MSGLTDKSASFADRLKLALTRSGISDERGMAAKVARHMGVSHVAVKKWLDGNGLPDQENLAILARWLSINIHWLSTGQGRIEIDDFKDDEVDLIKIYRSMDERGKRTLRSIAESESRYAA